MATRSPLALEFSRKLDDNAPSEDEMKIKAFSKDAGYRWLLTMLVAIISITGLSRMNFMLEMKTVQFGIQLSIVIYCTGLSLILIGHLRKSPAFFAASDFFCSVSQIWTFLVFAAGVQYIAAAHNLPLVDEFFLRADKALGFDWDAYNRWIATSTHVNTLLIFGYNSFYIQMFAIGLIHSARQKSDGNAEFAWCYMTMLLLVIAISAIAPAMGRPGMLGNHHIEVFLAARKGMVSDIAGIISFPSFHAAMGTLFIYSVRTIRPLLAIFLPLNVLLILATPPCGGHYLVDTLAGIAVAFLAISLVRQFQMRQASAAEYYLYHTDTA